MLIYLFLVIFITKSNTLCNLNEANIGFIQLKHNDTIIHSNLLQDCNSNISNLIISSIDSHAVEIDLKDLKQFPNLYAIEIKANIKDTNKIEWGSALRNVTYLSLHDCSINNILRTNFFNGLDGLQILNLSKNNLNSLPTKLFMGKNDFGVLDIAYNLFTEFPFFYLSKTNLTINITGNKINCICENVERFHKHNFLNHNFNQYCNIKPCNSFTKLPKNSTHITLNAQIAGKFTINCTVNTSLEPSFFVHSPIGTIPIPQWNVTYPKTNKAVYSYQVLPVRAPVTIVTLRLSSLSASITVNYARGHHKGNWHFIVILMSNSHDYPLNIFVTPDANVDNVYYHSLLVSLFVALATLISGIFIGTVRYLIETNCCRRPQLHKYGRTLIGIIPVPETKNIFKINKTDGIGDILLENRVCPTCLNLQKFFCEYCQTVHILSEFEIIQEKCKESAIKITETQCSEDVKPSLNPLLHTKDYSPNRTEYNTSSISYNNNISTDEHKNKTKTNKSAVAYNLSTVFCHCFHFKSVFYPFYDEINESPTRDVALIINDDKLAEEYTQALQVLQDAAESNDSAKFTERLEEFREKLLHDVGKGVRVVRDELASICDKSVQGVAYIRSQSSVAAQRMKAGLTQVKYGIRNVAEMCGVNGSIDQSISVINIAKDENNQMPQNRVINTFHFG